MSDGQSGGSDGAGSGAGKAESRRKPGPLDWVLLPLLPVRALFRWMYRDTDIRGELLGALIVACLILISAVTGYLYGGQEDKRQSRQMAREFELETYKAQLSALSSFSDGIPKNMLYGVLRRSQFIEAARELAVYQMTNDVEASNRALEAAAREVEIRMAWLDNTTHYLALCREVEAQFRDEAVDDSVLRTERVMHAMFVMVPSDVESLRSTVSAFRGALDAEASADVSGAVRDAIDDDLAAIDDELEAAVDLTSTEAEQTQALDRAARSLVSLSQQLIPELYSITMRAMATKLESRRDELEMEAEAASGGPLSVLSEAGI